MFKRILIATDGSELSQKEAGSGIELAKLSGGEVVALQVVRHAWAGMWADIGQATVGKLKAQAEAQGVQATGITTHSEMIAEAIIAAAKKHNCDLIVMASHGRRGLSRMLPGSETTHVLTHSDIPVMVLR